MRIAIVSDIHANLAAWNAVLADFSVQQVDKIICLGDIVGYGPEPARVLSSVYAHIDYFVLGNHDAVVAGLMEPQGFSPVARKLIDHTKKLLGDQAQKVFQKAPLLLKHNFFKASHGSPVAPKRFSYVMGKQDAERAWEKVNGQIFCVGHTHIPRIHLLCPTGQYRRFQAPEKPMRLKPENRYIINCGSVGLSRDGDFRACYAILDTEANTVCWQRLSYDIQAFRMAVQNTYQDDELRAFLLKRIDQTTRQPVRELIDFKPGQSNVSDHVTPQEDIELAHTRVKRWKLTATAIFALLIISLFLIIGIWQAMPKELEIGTEVNRHIEPETLIEGWAYDFMTADTSPVRPIPESWSAVLSDSKTQSIDYNERGLHISSQRELPLKAYLEPISLEDIREIEWVVKGTLANWKGPRPLLVLDNTYVTRGGNVLETVEEHELWFDENKPTNSFTVEAQGDTGIIRPRIIVHAEGAIEIKQLKTLFRPTEEKKILIRINQASLKDFEAISGIGSRLAERIGDRRKEKGGFQSIEQLTEVSGIAEIMLRKIIQHFSSE